MKSVVYEFDDGVGYAELSGGVKLDMTSITPNKKSEGKLFEVTDSEAESIKKSHDKTTVITGLLKAKSKNTIPPKKP